ncbi:hypothetical protein ERJ75_001287600 [Trypanosoma vivax]|nr:hypothetical protein ERJ75_001287600 [Trypanosoma vivax]
MVALLPPQRAPVHLDADAVMACVKSTQVDHTISCTGRAKGRQHAPAPVATEQSRVFSEAVAVEIGMWGDDPVGVDQIPMELVLPHENGSATFGIAGVVAATSRTHVAAFVPGASQHGAWDMYDGMVHRVVPNGPEPKTVVLLIYRRRRDEDADMDGVECSVGFDDANEECAPEGAGAEEDLKHAQKRPRDALAQAMPPEMPRDKRGRRAFGSKRKRTRGTPNATGSDMDEEDGETSMVELLRLVGEHLAQTHDGDETASLPHDPPASAENEEAAPQSEAGAEVDASTPNGDETASLPHDRRRVPRMRKRHRSRRRGGAHRPTVTRPRACLMTRRRVPRMRKRHRSRWRGGGAGDGNRSARGRVGDTGRGGGDRVVVAR